MKEKYGNGFSIPGGAGAILSTPMDMTIFIKSLFDLKLVSQDSLKQMTTMRNGEGSGAGGCPGATWFASA